MKTKKQARLRRAKKARAKISELKMPRLSVHKTAQHIYVQLISADGDKTLASASTVEKALRSSATGNCEAAAKVGALLAERAKEVGIAKVAFDRSGFKFHGRVKALADAAREAGIDF